MSILMDILRQYTGAAYSDLTSVLRSRINIVLKVDNIGDSIIFPVIPGDLPEVNSPQANDTFASVTGDINVMSVKTTPSSEQGQHSGMAGITSTG